MIVTVLSLFNLGYQTGVNYLHNHYTTVLGWLKLNFILENIEVRLQTTFLEAK